MANSIQAPIEYFFHEGKENLEECLRIAFETAVRRDVKTLVIFTGIGQGPRIALEKFRPQDCYADIKLIAVTFPYGHFKARELEDKASSMEISNEERAFLIKNDVRIVRAHMPFNPIAAHNKSHGVLGQDLSLIGNALSVFCGSMSLCVQATLMACDAGEVETGEHVIALTSDTAILARACPTERLLTDFIVREILCKPMSLTIIKKEARLTDPQSPITLEASVETPQLPPPEVPLRAPD